MKADAKKESARPRSRGRSFCIVQFSFSSLDERIRVGDAPEVTGEQHLYGLDLLPLGVGDRDGRAVVARPEIEQGAGDAPMQEVQDLCQSGGLRWRQLRR